MTTGKQHSGKWGGQTPLTMNKGSEEKFMYTVSDIIADINRGCIANNMLEDRFRYRIIYFVNDGSNGTKYYIDTAYNGLRKSLENIIRSNLSLTNSIVIAETTVLKNGKCVCLQSRSYSFSLDGYFKQISGEYSDSNGNIMYGRYAVR